MLSFTLVGCSQLFGYQPPAPVYGSDKPTDPYGRHGRQATKNPIVSPNTTYQSTIKQPQISQVKGTNKKSVSTTVSVKKPMSPAILALIAEANNYSHSGDQESAVATIERALRIDSRNPTLTYKLAELRLKQSKPRLAEDLATKAALLSASDLGLKKQSWLLISEARRQQKNYYGAKEAKAKANSL